jgi:NADH-quinone oxidoreductase subunit K
LLLAGLYGLMVLRNLFKLMVALQILVKGVILALVAAGYASGQIQVGQSLAVTVIVADTVVAVVALALAI